MTGPPCHREIDRISRDDLRVVVDFRRWQPDVLENLHARVDGCHARHPQRYMTGERDPAGFRRLAHLPEGA